MFRAQFFRAMVVVAKILGWVLFINSSSYLILLGILDLMMVAMVFLAEFVPRKLETLSYNATAQFLCFCI